MIFVSVSVFFLNLEFAEFQGVLAPWDLATSLAEEELGPDPRRRASHGARHRRPIFLGWGQRFVWEPNQSQWFFGVDILGEVDGWPPWISGSFLDFWTEVFQSVESPKRSQGCGSSRNACCLRRPSTWRSSCWAPMIWPVTRISNSLSSCNRT